MAQPVADALVFFGAAGDLAFKQIFPALQALVERGALAVPVVGVAKAGWGVEQLRERARASLARHGAVDAAAFARLAALLRYVDGDYRDPATFRQLRAALGEARRPLSVYGSYCTMGLRRRCTNGLRRRCTTAFQPRCTSRASHGVS